MVTSAIGFPPGTIYDITDITRACPGVMTLLSTSAPNSFDVSEGDTVSVRNVNGMFQVNFSRFIVKNLDVGLGTFELYDLYGKPVDTSTYAPYDSGGQIDIISYPGTPPGLMYNNQ